MRLDKFILPRKTWSFGPPARRAYASESHVRDRWLCLGVLCLKSQILSTPPKERRAGKLQINPPAIASSPASQARRGGLGHERAGLKLQITNSKPVQRSAQALVQRVVICLPC